MRSLAAAVGAQSDTANCCALFSAITTEHLAGAPGPVAGRNLGPFAVSGRAMRKRRARRRRRHRHPRRPVSSRFREKNGTVSFANGSVTGAGEPLRSSGVAAALIESDARAAHSRTELPVVRLRGDGRGALGAPPAPVRPDEACHRAPRRKKKERDARFTRVPRAFRASGARRFALAPSRPGGRRRAHSAAWLHSRSRWSRPEHSLYLLYGESRICRHEGPSRFVFRPAPGVQRVVCRRRPRSTQH